MSALRLAWTELRRITATRGVVITLVAMLLIPTIYGGMYLYANRDPYGSLAKVPAAVVVQDTGATRADGTRVHAGQDLADTLVSDGAFAWHQVDASTAAAGVDDGTYDFSVTIPAGFSHDVATLGTASSQRATIVLATNDATNYLARTIATTAMERIRSTLASQIGEQAAQQSLAGFTTVSSQLTSASSGAQRLADGATSAQRGAASLSAGAASLADGSASAATGAARLATGASHAASGAATLSSGATRLSTGLADLASSTSSLPAQTSALAAGAQQVSDGAATAASSSRHLAQGSQQVTAGLAALQASLRSELTAAGVPAAQVDAAVAQVAALHSGSQQVTSGLGSLVTGTQGLAAGSAQVSAGTTSLATAAPALSAGAAHASTAASQLAAGARTLSAGTAAVSSGASSLASGTSSIASGASSVAHGSASLASGATTLAEGATSLHSGLAKGAAAIPTVPTAAQAAVAADVANPVTVSSENASKAATYGAGLAPFFLTLSLWIGGYVLFMLVRPMSRRALAADQKPWHVAVGGWLVPALLGVVQAVLVTLVVSHGVGVEPVNLLGTVAFLALVSITFIAIIQMLTAWFGPVGQFLALVLMILQLVSAGGTFPWQTLPEGLWPAHEVLPMSYAISGLRALFYGGDLSTLVVPALVLVGYLVAALGLTALAAHRQRTWTPSRLRPAVAL